MITENEFKKYVKVQVSGATNMFNLVLVQSLSGLTREKITEIIENYEQLEEKFPKVME